MEHPVLKVGIMAERAVECCLHGSFLQFPGNEVVSGRKQLLFADGMIHMDGQPVQGDCLEFKPVDAGTAAFEILDVTIGIQFHWERKENQLFRGSLQFLAVENEMHTINLVPLEDYLESVISSEMNATSSLELLKAHAVISRSWLLAQVIKGKELSEAPRKYQTIWQTGEEYIRWYDREDHRWFDVCADDHCQRYQGITRQTSPLAEKAVRGTAGLVLMYDGKICDARFSKSCGGVTEAFEKVWEPVAHPYLRTLADTGNTHGEMIPDLRVEEEAQKWILGSPEAFCNTTDHKVLSQVLNDYDQETVDFYRWKVSFTQEELTRLLKKKTGIDFGEVIDLVPLERGYSGRIVRLKIIGTHRTWIVGKELEIRKILSESHLYSSAFVVDRQEISNRIPARFVLTGAGWGHGVGLCQIGAAMMGEMGYSHSEILTHYFPGASLEKSYDT